MKRSIVITGKETVEVIEEPLPAVGPGELLVETTRTMVSTGTEGILFSRNFSPGTHWDEWLRYPFCPGYLHAGRVVEIGAGVEGWKVGDRVASRSVHASHVLVAAETGVPIPDALSDEEAAWMGLGKIVQVGARSAAPVMGDVVVVIGLGLVGQLAVQYARLMGASQVVAVDTAPLRLEMAQAHGATHSLQMTAAQVLEPLEALTDGRRADTVYDVTGHPEVFSAALGLARRFGTLVLLGDTGTPERQTLTTDVITRGVRIVGAHDTHPHPLPHELARWSAREMSELFLLYLARGQIRVSDLITHRRRPDEAHEVYTLLQRERQSVMGVVFEWQS